MKQSREQHCQALHLNDWRKIPIALIDTGKGEQTAQTCVNAWLQQLSFKTLTCNPEWRQAEDPLCEYFYCCCC
jgi:hypothetical protein